jgi:hypothetical protein
MATRFFFIIIVITLWIFIAGCPVDYLLLWFIHKREQKLLKTGKTYEAERAGK